MCGIVGLMGINEAVENYKEIDSMMKEMHHRGPNDSGICAYCNDASFYSGEGTKMYIPSAVRLIMGFKRLSIQDLSKAGHQPMIYEKAGLILTYNGEIYNTEVLKKNLMEKGYSFLSHSDTEVLLYLILEYGIEDAVKKLNGMYAFVLFDKRKQTVFFCRDRLGIIPLYMYRDGNHVAWSSEIKSFLHDSYCRREINPIGLSEALMYSFPTGSLLKNVELIEPGIIKSIDINTGQTIQIKYWDIDDICADTISSGKKIEEYIDEADHLLRKCVKRQLIGDVNVGVQFSGGVDSSLVAKYVFDEYTQKRGKRLYGYSLINSESEQNNEEHWIDYAASFMDIKLVKSDMNCEMFLNQLKNCTFQFERFVSTASAIGINEFSRNAHKNVTVLLSGEGADELCGGYKEFIQYKKNEQEARNLGIRNIYTGYAEDVEVMNYTLTIKCNLPPEVCRMFYPDFNHMPFVNDRKDYFQKLNGSFFEKHRKMLLKYHLAGLLERQNKMCMGNSIENRVPILDNEFIDYCLKVPEDVLIHFYESEENYVGKYILKEMCTRYYSHDFAYRPKTNMRIPIMEYARASGFKNYVMEEIIPSMRRRELINVEKFITLFNGINSKNVMLLWKLINLELWCQCFIDGCYK